MKAEEYLQGLTVYDEPIHQSTVSSALGCMRYFLFREKWRLFPKNAPYTPAAGLGTLFHRFMELGKDRLGEVAEEVRAKQAELMDRISKGEDLTGDLTRTMNGMTEKHDKALMMAHMVWAKYPEDSQEIICSEQKVRMTLPGIGTIEGMLDKLVKFESGKFWIRDYKTSSRDCKYTMTGYLWGIQLRVYRLLAEAYLRATQNTGVTGFVLDVVQTPTIKFCKKDKDFNAYMERCKVWYDEKDKQAIVSAGYVFQEPILNRELTNALSTVALFKSMPADVTEFHRDVTGRYCTLWDKVCVYADLCNMSVDGWPGIIEQSYEIKPPAPIDEDVLVLEEGKEEVKDA